MTPPTGRDDIRDAALLAIARRELLLDIDSFEPRRGAADFREVAVWTVEAALVAAYEAGRAAATAKGHTVVRADGREVTVTVPD